MTRGWCSRCLLRLLFYPVAKGNYPFSLVVTYFNYAQFKAENVIRALALEMRSMKEFVRKQSVPYATTCDVLGRT